MVPRNVDQVYAYTCINKKIPIENSRVHSMLGHSGKKCVIATAKFYGWKLKGDFKTCQDCAMAKARQKNIAKTTSTKSTVGGERLFLDIASVNQSSFGGNQYWILVLDNFSGFCWTFFCKEKSDLPEITLKLLKDLAQSGKKVKYIRYDGAGENKFLKALCDSEERGITFEFTARNTPQHNGRVERKFQTLFARTRAMLNAANFTPAWRKGVWPEAASTATNIDNALVHKEGEAPPHVKLFGREPKFIEHLRTFGEVTIALDPTKHKIRGKLDNRGEAVVFMGYPKDYAGDTYRMMNIATRQICHTRDLIWLNKSFGKYKQIVPNDEFDEETIEYDNENDALDDQDSNGRDLDSSDSDDEEPKDLGILQRPMPRNQHPPTPIITDDEDGSNKEEEIIFEREKPIAEESEPMELFHNYSNSEQEEDEDVNQPTKSDNAQSKGKEDTSSNTIAAKPMESPPKQYRTRAVIKRARDRLLKTSPTYRQMQKLKTDYNPTASNVVNKIDKQVNEANDTNEKANVHFEMPLWNYIFLEQQLGREETCNMIIDVQKLELPDAYTHTPIVADTCYYLDGKPIPETPKSFRSAWDNEDPKERELWREAIRKEFKDMNTRKVWRKIKKRDIPEGRRCVKHKWVFNIKRDGRHRARLVACGYSQIPGVDYTDNYAPVVNDVTYRIMMVCMLIFHLKGVLVDVETAFLHGELEGNDIYMECPKGMVHMEDECLQLMKTIYGLVQSARQFYKKLKVKLLKLGFEEGIVDPCLMVRKNKLGIVMIAIYVDDCLMIGKQEAIDDAIAGLEKSRFKLKIENELTDYLSCNIIFNKSKTKAWVGQPHLLKNLREKFGERVKKLQMYRTPGTPGYGVLRPEKDDPMQVSKEEHTIYRSGVGMLLYLVKHTRPDIANITRELSKVMDKPTKAELHRAIKFVLDTADYGLKIEPVK